MAGLDSILDRFEIPQTDRPAFCALVDSGTRPDTALRAKLRRGRYKAALEEALAVLSGDILDCFPHA